MYPYDRNHCTHLPILQIDFVAQHHKGEVLWVARAGLDEKLIPPAVQCLEGVWGSDVEHQHTAVGTAVESHTQRLEPLLTCCVPYLNETTQNTHINLLSYMNILSGCIIKHLQTDRFIQYASDIVIIFVFLGRNKVIHAWNNIRVRKKKRPLKPSLSL